MVLFDFQAPYSVFESYAYDTFIAPAVSDFASQIFPKFREAVGSGGHLLDVGCGGGQNAERVLAEIDSCRLTGIDLSADQIGRARKRLERFPGRVTLKTGDALALPLDSESFDVVYSIASLKHWSDRSQGLAECVRVLKRGGMLAVAEADKDAGWQECAAFTANWRIPAVFKPAATFFFQRVVAGNSLTKSEAARLLSPLPLSGQKVEAIAGLPGFVMIGTKM